MHGQNHIKFVLFCMDIETEALVYWCVYRS